jgi:hypothetical protein
MVAPRACTPAVCTAQARCTRTLPQCAAASPPPQQRRRRRDVCASAAFGRPPAADPFAAPPPRTRRETPPAPPPPADAEDGTAARGELFWDDTLPTPVFDVPLALRAPGAPPHTSFARMESLERLFPGTGLSAAFHSNASFRTALRNATRADLFRDPGRGASAAALIRGARSTMVLDWRPAVAPGAVCAEMDAALKAANVALSGADLLRGLTALCVASDARGDAVAGSLTDIVENGRQQVRHSWHQDSGLRVNTVLLVRFPACVA